MIIDIIVVALLVIGIIVGYKKGFAKIVLKLVGFILALVLAYIFCNSVAKYIYNDTGMGEKLSESIEQNLNGYINNKKEETNVDDYYKNIESFLTSSEKQDIKEDTTMVNKVADKISMYIIKGASFILIVIVVNLCVFILSLIFEGIFSLPVLKTFNKTGGCIVSFVLTLLKLWIILGILSLLSSVGIIDSVIKQINNSVITNWLYNNNILMSVILKSIQK